MNHPKLPCHCLAAHPWLPATSAVVPSGISIVNKRKSSVSNGGVTGRVLKCPASSLHGGTTRTRKGNPRALVQEIEYVGDVAAAVGETAKKVAAAAQEVEKAFKTIYDIIDTTHTVSIRVVNLTGHTFELTKHEHDHGNWADDPGMGHNVFPAVAIGSWQLSGCLTKDIGLWTGTEGKLSYKSEAGGNHHFATFYWDNPGPLSLQSNDCWAISGKLNYENGKLVMGWPPFLNSDAIKVHSFITGGNRANASYIIMDADLPADAEEQLNVKLALVNSMPWLPGLVDIV